MPRTRASSEDPHSKQPAKRQKRSAEAEAVQREDSIFSARTEISEDTKATNIENAYAIIENYNLTSTRQHDDLVQPTLRTFLEFLPEDGKHSLLKDINSAMDDDQKLYQIFHNLYTGLRTPMLARSKTPSITPSPNPRREEHADALSISIDTPISRQDRFKKLLLKRDNHQCLITGWYDQYWHESMDIDDPELNSTVTAGAHIIPFSYGSWNPAQSLPSDIAKAWEVLFRCFPTLRVIGFSHEHLNDLTNGLTLAEWAHGMFGRFKLAFKSTDILHRYHIEVFGRMGKGHRDTIQSPVTFENHDQDQDHELPSPVLLDCHYRLAHILHASGMSEAFERDFDQWQRTKYLVHGLEQDGTTDITGILKASL